jgi:hypothetical protein
LIVGHLEYLVIPFALNVGGFESVLMVVYPLLLGYMVVGPVFGRRRGQRASSLLPED